MKRIALLLVMVASMDVYVDAQGCGLSEDQIRVMTKTARAGNGTKTADFLKALDLSVRGTLRKPTTPHIVVSFTDALMIWIESPYSSYRSSVEEQLRKMEPIEDVSWRESFRLVVYPRQIDAPDITKIVVQRDGVTVEPIDGSLESKPLETRMGAKRDIHVGALDYSCSAFAPGGTVTVTAIPESGSNIVKIIKSEVLAQYR